MFNRLVGICAPGCRSHRGSNGQKDSAKRLRWQFPPFSCSRVNLRPAIEDGGFCTALFGSFLFPCFQTNKMRPVTSVEISNVGRRQRRRLSSKSKKG
ncbi:uncharacterized protein P884DRAFT_254821 [Thermothelomyces heterothallicus CBS 202.75]|uniref:uncharacterized protein n=1 Tax=Thermothelomyces heterothallicus CBS 202.75 TaxID=1149848 RepID=UPI003742AE99